MIIRTVVIGERKCGRKKAGKFYLIAGEGEAGGVLKRFSRINPPVPYPVPVHRAPRQVSAQAILERAPLEEWWLGAARKTEDHKLGEAWAQDTFGMSAHKRLTTGECEGAKDVDEALAMLTSQLELRSPRHLLRAFRALGTEHKIQEQPRQAADYNRLQEHLIRLMDGKAVYLHMMEAQAATWRMAYNLRPSNRKEIIPVLARMLASIGLTKDAAAMQRIFLEKE